MEDLPPGPTFDRALRKLYMLAGLESGWSAEDAARDADARMRVWERT